MKFDKRYLIAASLVLAMGVGAYGCSDDDKDNSNPDEPQKIECTGEHKKADGDKCVCEDGYKLDGEDCVEDTGKPADDCKGDHKKKDGDKCVCEDGYKLDGEDCVEDTAKPTDECKGDHQKKDGDNCVCDTGYKDDGKGNCVEDTQPVDCEENPHATECKQPVVKPETCGNNVLDAGEVCDIVEGADAFAEGEDTCEKWASENNLTLATDVEQGKPGCADNCMARRANPKSGKGCTSTQKALCGNGKIDEGELCDTKDGEVIFADSVEDKSCKATYGKGEGSFVADGIPGCNATCDGWSKGTCDDEGTVKDVNGIVSCEATITVDESHKATGSAKATTKDSKAAKGQIICAINTSDIAPVLNSIKDKLIAGTADGDAYAIANAEYDGSVFTDAGDYSCAFYIEVEAGKGVVCKDNKPIAASGSIADLGIATFSIAGSGDATEIAAWTTFSAEINKAISGDGAAPNSGTDTAAKLKFNLQSGKKINVKLGQDAANSTTALSLDASGNTSAWGTEANMSSNSYLAITSTELASATNAKLVLKVNTKGNTIAVTSVKDSKESVVDDKITSSAFEDKEIAIPDGAGEIHIYNISGAKAIAFDDIIVKK